MSKDPIQIFSDTVVALCTPQGNGAIALIRISGPSSWNVGQKFISLISGKKLDEVTSHTVHAAIVHNASEHVDTVMVLALKGPKTFTGYDTIEITCHNNALIIQSIIELAIKHGARPAQQGQFTRQAYENKKIDLLQAEAIHELITAQTQTALKKSLSQLQGSLSDQVASIEDMLCKSIAWCETSFEFLDDAGDFFLEISQFLRAIIEKIEPIISGYAAQKQIRQGYRIALIGAVNAGKSSLFNLLIGHKRAIVTPIAGTTRDSIEASQIIDHMVITLIDTAGLRVTADLIEQEGIERSFSEAHASDVILLVIDGSRALTQQENIIYRDLIEKYEKKIIFIQNKSDIEQKKHNFFEKLDIEPLIISTQNNNEKNLLEAELVKKISLLSRNHALPFLINKRHYELLQAVYNDINLILNMLENSGTTPHYELISHHLRQALEQISELTGKSVSEQALDRVFKEFCVGK
ncbi:MAG: tRNA uridine-5-carboxymethylaminomethyl(34) synthesis GTPase MnmE [Candidatus Babeliaceae bacterium]|nr:tRNA uridine-5-carboxymethylaminomethyl(34) synthesis GTPase MnmE [Candidatus Babeliaceae bacterium]